MNTKNLVINWHLLEPCQFKCRYCFAEWNKCEKPEIYRDTEKSKMLIDEIATLARGRSVRLSLAGGEPLLDKKISEKIAWAHHKSLKISLITNGDLLSRRLDDLSLGRLYMLGISIDSFNQQNNLIIGRSTDSGEVADYSGDILPYIQHARAVHPDIKIKINTVVNKFNWNDDMSQEITQISPYKWKIMRVLPATSKAMSETISNKEFETFKSRHKHLTFTQFEDNDDMRSSYLMLDPYGRFFSNSGTEYRYSDSVLDVGIECAMRKAEFNQSKFIARYDGEVE